MKSLFAQWLGLSILAVSFLYCHYTFVIIIVIIIIIVIALCYCVVTYRRQQRLHRESRVFDTNMHNASSNKCITEACRQANANEITRVCIFTIHSRYARIGTHHQHVTQLLVAVSQHVDMLFAMFNLVSAFVSLFKLLHTLYRMCYSWCAFRDAGVCFGAAVVFIM